MGLPITLRLERRRENVNYGKVYGQVKNAAPIGLDKLAEHMSAHNCNFSLGTILGVLTDMVRCIKEMLIEGQPVKLPDLAIFYAKVESSAANTVQDFDLSKNIKAVKLLATGTGEMTRAEMKKSSTFEYTELAKKVRDGRVDIEDLYDDEDEGGGGGGDDDPDPVRP